MKLNTQERLIAMGLLPETGDFVTLNTIDAARKSIGLKPEEVEEFDFKISEDRKNWLWNLKGNEEREIELSKAAIRMLEEELVKLNEDKKLTANHITLYKKVVGE
jgi:hypothetical protein